MNWAVLLIAFFLALAIASRIATALKQRRPKWSGRRQVLVAAAVVPALIVVLMSLGVIWYQATGPKHGESNRDLLSFIIVAVGSIFMVITFVGGLVGAGMATNRWEQ
jgi:Na+/proline symporter